MNRLAEGKLTLLQIIFLVSCLVFPMTGYGGYAGECTDANTLKPDISGKPLEIKGGEVKCIGAGTYNYSLVNIHGTIDKDGNTVAEGKLIFKDAKIDFWAKSILVENGGSLIIGSPEAPIENRITIHLYGSDAGPGITCKTTTGPVNSPDMICGVPIKKWMDSSQKIPLPAPDGTPADKIPNDYFYKYGNLPTYTGQDAKDGDYYFGRKVLAVSYGGTLRLFGRKGATYESDYKSLDPEKQDVSRVVFYNKRMKKGDWHFDSERFVDWKKGHRVLFKDKKTGIYEVREIATVSRDPNDLHTSIIIANGLTKDIASEGGYIVLLHNSATSWGRLDGTVGTDSGNKLTLDREVDWQKEDKIVVTTTDYLPGHSEELTIDQIPDKKTITFREKLKYLHNGNKYSLAAVPDRLKKDGFNLTEAETRSAVALLTRNIRIVSEKCDSYDQQKCQGMPEEAGSFFGGHTIVRQGVKQYQMQGVEFFQLGQGGRMSHSPVNFHLVRQAPPDTFVKDCSVNESMTRWYEIRGAQNVTLERNVGWKSIGHGYSLADGSEANNTLRANIGIFARPSVGKYGDDGKIASLGFNPRMVPGVLGAANTLSYKGGLFDDYTGGLKYCKDVAQTMKSSSDYVHPSVFLIMNAYNTFEFNMAAGAGTCGSCYWIVPSNVGGPSASQVWEGYANIQKKNVRKGRTSPGTAPIKAFRGNFCSTAMHSLVTVGGTGACDGTTTCSADEKPDPDIKNDDIYKFVPIKNSYTYDDADYPDVTESANLTPVKCKNEKEPCRDSQDLDDFFSPCIKGDTKDCVLSVIDSYTSSFHWANINFSAIWLRNNWFLMTDSILSDVLQGGLTMVSGGSYDQVINGYWALTRRSAFIGNTQQWEMTDELTRPKGNPFASNAGPFNLYSGLVCEDMLNPKNKGHIIPAAICQSRNEGISMPTSTFGNYQRLYNIYDGPVYQEANAYLDIKKTPVNCGNSNGLCASSQYMYGANEKMGTMPRAMGIPRAKEYPFKGKCILPNAAIGWKQPNGFYYPPAFHSNNLFFDNVDLRHYIIVPLFSPGSMDVNTDQVKAEYCSYDSGRPGSLFASSFTDVDRQTELNDNDGSLAGIGGVSGDTQKILGGGTISVNRDKFFQVPSETVECLSEQSCFQVPYDYVTAVVYPSAVVAQGGAEDKVYCPQNSWCASCKDTSCYGVPLYRQLIKEDEVKGEEQSIRMMGAGIFQRSTLIANNGIYYLNTLASEKVQRDLPKNADGFNGASVFEKGKTYNVFLLYAKPSTRVTFQLYVGTGLKDADISLVRAGSKAKSDKDFEDNNVVIVTKLDTAKPMEFTTDTKWPASWIKKYDADSGMLTVLMDMSGFADDLRKSAKESCRPYTFCKWQADDNDKVDGGKCVYNADQKIIDYYGDDSICKWAVKARECPSGGCLGFQFKFNGEKEAYDNDRRPEPTKFTAAGKYYAGLKDGLKWDYASDWLIDWRYADIKLSGDDKLKEYTESFTISGINGNVINLSGSIKDDGKYGYTVVKRLDASKKVVGWAWIDRDNIPKKGDTKVTLDKAVDWKQGDAIQVSTPSACVYTKENSPPPVPDNLWFKKK